MIKLTNVSKEYPKRGFALRDVTLRVGKGEFAFLTGHSGSGKTTTMRLIHMAERPTEGEVRVSGYSSDRITERDLWKVRRRVGFVFQDFRLLPGRTAIENVAFALEVTGTPSRAIQAKAQRLLSQVGLSTKAGAFVNELSGGEQQRVGIARALANDPYVLLADEPTGNLDDRATRGILDLFWNIQAKGMAVVMATHDLELVRRYPSARVLELDHGSLVYDSTRTDEGTDFGYDQKDRRIDGVAVGDGTGEDDRAPVGDDDGSGEDDRAPVADDDGSGEGAPAAGDEPADVGRGRNGGTETARPGTEGEGAPGGA